MSKPLSTEQIQKICCCIVEQFHPVRVILYGSYASRTYTPDSDIDFLVVTLTPLSQKVITSQIRKTLPSTLRRTSMDIIAVDATEYEETKDIIGGLTYPASKYGKVIYENS